MARSSFAEEERAAVLKYLWKPKGESSGRPPPSPEPNFKNRTLFHGDNLDFLRGIDSGTIDLIATDPPFNKQIERQGIEGSDCEDAEYDDNWSWEKNVHPSWLKLIEEDHPAIKEVIEGACEAHDEGMGAFLCFMAVRLLSMKRVLKDTGSIFLHCDPTASHYIKAIMDAVFGAENFRNQIVWCYKENETAEKWFPKKHDIIFWYSKSDEYTFNMQRGEFTEAQLKRYNHVKPDGTRWANMKGKMRQLKGGARLRDWWEMPICQSNERIGYPTQKPIALYQRIVKAGSNPGEWVLDPFCGSGTTCIAAEQLDRKWAGIDKWAGAKEVILSRIQSECDGLDGGDVTPTSEVPKRSDPGETASPTFVQPKRGKKMRRMNRKEREEALKKLIANRGGCICDGCGRSFEREYAHVDHDKPLHAGGTNDISNLNLLCSVCNNIKKHWFTLEGLRREIRRIAKDVADHLHEWAKKSPFITGAPSK